MSSKNAPGLILKLTLIYDRCFKNIKYKIERERDLGNSCVNQPRSALLFR